MKMRSTLLAFIAGALLCVAACGSEEQSTADGQALPMEPLVGVDTTKPYITAVEDARQKRILLIPYTEKGLWGFADTTGTIQIEPVYKYVKRFDDSNITLVQGQDDCFGLMDKTGKVVEPIVHQWIYVCGNDVFGFEKEGHIQLKNRENRRIDHGEVIGTFNYANEGLNAVRTKRGIGFMDTDGYMVVNDEYEYVSQFNHGVACVAEDNDEWHVIDRASKRITDLTFHNIYPFTNGYGVGSLAGDDAEAHWGIIDTLGNVVVPFQYGQMMGDFEDDYIACPTSTSWDMFQTQKYHFEILNKRGKKITETNLDIGDNFIEGLAVVEQNGRYGYVDSMARVVIPIQYEWTGGFKNGLAWVQKNGRYGFINKQGKVVIPIKYDSAYDYVDMEEQGATVVDPKTKERFYIDKTGREYRDFSR